MRTVGLTFHEDTQAAPAVEAGASLPEAGTAAPEAGHKTPPLLRHRKRRWRT